MFSPRSDARSRPRSAGPAVPRDLLGLAESAELDVARLMKQAAGALKRPAVIPAATPIKVGAGISQVSFDLYYDASQLKGDAALKAKIYAGSTAGDVVIDQPIDDMGMAKAKDVPGTHLKKAHVRAILEDKVTADIGHFELSIVGYLTSYKGALYIDNIELK